MSIERSNSSQDLIARTQPLEDNSQGFTFKTKHIALVKTSWVQRHPDAVRNLKIAGVTALVLGLLVGGGLLAMHFTVGINSAGFDKLWTALTTKHQFTTAQVILYGVVPVVGIGTAGVLAYKLVACYRAHHKDDQSRFHDLKVESTDQPWVEEGAEIGREEGKPANRGRSNSLPTRRERSEVEREAVLIEEEEEVVLYTHSQRQEMEEKTPELKGKEKSDVEEVVNDPLQKKEKTYEELFEELTGGEDSGLFG